MGRAFIGNFKGPPGDEGKQGKQGIQGPMGPAGPTGAVDGNTPIEFTEAEALANIESGESISTIFGKTKKILGSLLIGAGSTLLGNNLTANQALVSDASGKVNVSGISATELGYLSGITKNIQTQFSEQNEKLGGYLPTGGYLDTTNDTINNMTNVGISRTWTSGSSDDAKYLGFSGGYLFIINSICAGRLMQLIIATEKPFMAVRMNVTAGDIH